MQTMDQITGARLRRWARILSNPDSRIDDPDGPFLPLSAAEADELAALLEQLVDDDGSGG